MFPAWAGADGARLRPASAAGGRLRVDPDGGVSIVNVDSVFDFTPCDTNVWNNGEPVTHASGRGPRDVGVGRAGRVTHVFGGLADDLDQLGQGETEQLVVFQVLPGTAVGLPGCLLGGVDQVL